VPEPHSAGCGLVPPENRLEQRRLARAVRADQRHVLAALEREGDTREQGLLAGRNAEPFGLEHGAAAPSRVEEVEAEALATARKEVDLPRRMSAFLLEALDLRELHLRLSGHLLRRRAEALDEPLEPLDVPTEPVRRLRGSV
jgi:hypothetical protein